MLLPLPDPVEAAPCGRPSTPWTRKKMIQNKEHIIATDKENIDESDVDESEM